MRTILIILGAALLGLVSFGCSSRDSSSASNYGRYSSPSYYSKPSTYQRYQPSYVRAEPRPRSRSRSTSSLLREVSLRRDVISRGARGRTGRSMTPRYITIHSTQNWSQGADAYRHAAALRNSKLGSIGWHFTTDENVAIQHLPTSEQGNHADHNGPGNRYSIGIEMCEHPGNSRSATMERSAKLAAYLMVKHNIPLNRVVPHYHWPRWGKNPPNKNCPHYLMTNGKPGAKWQAFLRKVNRYHREVSSASYSYATL